MKLEVQRYSIQKPFIKGYGNIAFEHSQFQNDIFTYETYNKMTRFKIKADT